MKTTYRTTHIYKPHSRAERALTLAVLTALLSGAAATPAMAAAKNVTIAEDETVDASYTKHKACLKYDANATDAEANKTNSPSGNTLTILGKVIKSDTYATSYVTAAYSGGGGTDVLSENHVFIQGGTFEIGAGYVCGSYSKSGDVKSNHLEISAGTVGDGVRACGGYSEKGAVTGNTVAISGGTVNSWVYGGYSYNIYDATANTVQITDNTVRITGGEVLYAWGGYSMKGAVKNNTVTLAGGTIKSRAHGGESGYGDVANNTVEITGGTVQGDKVAVVCGGSSTYGAAKNNQVNISAGTVNTTYGVNGGRSQTGAATGNTVTISGGTITGKVVGGACYNTATDNKVILAKGAAAANLNNATLYGSIKGVEGPTTLNVGLPTTHSGNTLTVDGEKNITLATVKNFDVYDFKLGDVKNGDAILNLQDDTDLGTADVKAEGAITGKRKIYLMKLADGKTLAFAAGDGTTNTSEVTQNAKKTATLTRTRKVEQEDNNLLLVDNIAYDFGLTPDTMKNGYIHLHHSCGHGEYGSNDD